MHCILTELRQERQSSFSETRHFCALVKSAKNINLENSQSITCTLETKPDISKLQILGQFNEGNSKNILHFNCNNFIIDEFEIILRTCPDFHFFAPRIIFETSLLELTIVWQSYGAPLLFPILLLQRWLSVRMTAALVFDSQVQISCNFIKWNRFVPDLN